MQNLIIEALKYYGLAETPGPKTTPTIKKMLDELGYPFSDDETSWCGTFMSWVTKQCGLPHPAKGYGAKEWLNWGQSIQTPEMGDVAVFWRVSPTDWQGHVALFVNRVGDTVYILGGNQSNQVSIMGMPANRLLGYRRYAPAA